jgi:hypothetical protein
MFSLLEEPQALNEKSNLKTNGEKKQKQINKGPQEKISTKTKNEEKKKPTDKNYKKQDSSQFNLGWVCG